MENGRLRDQLIIPPDRFAQALRETVETIDHVHCVPIFPALPILLSSERFGGYVPETESRSRHIELSLNGPCPRLTLAHEIGRLLDDLMGNFVVYTSTEPASLLTEVLAVAKESRALAAMRDFLADTLTAPAIVRYQLQNWLEPPEI